MSTTSKNFDPSQMIDELIGFVRNRANDMRGRANKANPNQKQAEAAVLNAIATESKNAAEITRGISLSSGGAWVPTSGEVQATLKLLTESGLATSKTKGDRKIYSITPAGLEALDAADFTEATRDSGEQGYTSKGWMTCDRNYLYSATKLGPVLLDLAQTGTRDQQTRAAEILEQARHQLHVILSEN